MCGLPRLQDRTLGNLSGAIPLRCPEVRAPPALGQQFGAPQGMWMRHVREDRDCEGRRVTRPEPLPAPFADRPFTVREALAEGVPAHRLRATDLSRPFHGIRTGDAPSTLWDRCYAYAAGMPDSSFFCGSTAAQLHGLPVPPQRKDELHVASVSPKNAPRGRGVVGHKLRALPGDVIVLDGLRVSSAPRAWCELAAQVRIEDLVAAGDRYLWRKDPFGPLEALTTAVAHHPGRRGKRNLDRALELLSDRADSPQESRLRVMLIDGGVTGLEVNHPVRIRGRQFFIDLAIPDRKIAIEYLGEHHGTGDFWRRDAWRRSQLESEGWIVVELVSEDLADPIALAHRILSIRRR